LVAEDALAVGDPGGILHKMSFQSPDAAYTVGKTDRKNSAGSANVAFPAGAEAVPPVLK
jgi:hypothetical protein